MEFLSLAVFGFLIVVSPGSDFVLVLKNSMAKGRTAGMLTALGIALSICVHSSYSIFGISHLISQNIFLFNAIKYIGALYLIYLGICGLFASKTQISEQHAKQPHQTAGKYVMQGFLCNLLNPKTMLFFLSVFSQLLTTDNSTLSFVIVYGLYIALLHGIWFSLLSFVVTSKGSSNIFQRFGQRINQLCGAGLVSFGAALLASKQL
ncbi:LysE family translocator [Agarivorans sp. QJM3NY_29]|uniref:LysE family translocator n=1 Tax=unclassified Agarivorans TaxID=2636026 RepID=UPI003D7D925D